MGTERAEKIDGQETDVEWIKRKIREGQESGAAEEIARAVAEDAERVRRGEPSRIRGCRPEDMLD